ncbi:MAG: hypothetical protein MHMPM18_003342 [Marteilia pararefringens]
MASQLALCVSILIIAAAFLASAVASLFLKNHRSSTRSGSISSTQVQSSTSQENISSTQDQSPTRSRKIFSSLHQLPINLGNWISSLRLQFKRLRKGSSSPDSNEEQVDLDADNPKSWQKGDIVEDKTSVGGEQFTILGVKSFNPVMFYGSNSAGDVVTLLPKNFTRAEKSKYEDNNYKFQIGDEVKLLVKFHEIEKGTKGTITNPACKFLPGNCLVVFDNTKDRSIRPWYLGKLKQKYQAQ